MNILIINCILSTAENGIVKRRKSIKDCMISNFAQGFIAAGHSVTILASEEFRPTESESYPFEIIYFKSRLPKVFKPHLIPFPIGMRKYLKANIQNFDMVVSSEAFSLATLLAASICGDKMVVWQEMAFHQNLFHKLPSKIWHNVAVRFFMNKALFVPRSLPAEKFISQYATNVSKEIVDHGANGDLLYPEEAADDAFIVVSQLVPRKNVGSIIRKFASLVNDSAYSHYRLDIIGEGTDAEMLKALAKELGIDDRVIFHGFMRHSDMAAMLRRAKAMLIDTHKDLNMVSIPESLISGTPIVTNMNTTTAQYIRRMNLGIARDGWDASDLKEIISNYDRYHKACLDVRDNLTNVGCARKMVTLYSNWRGSNN